MAANYVPGIFGSDRFTAENIANAVVGAAEIGFMSFRGFFSYIYFLNLTLCLVKRYNITCVNVNAVNYENFGGNTCP